MNDREFRLQELVLPSGFAITHRGTAVANDGYKPDLLIAYEGNPIAVVESSSTGDRKVSIGELLQAHKFFHERGASGVLLFSLCGRGTTAPRPETQLEYLWPYFRYLSQAGAAGVKTVHLMSQSIFLESISALLSGERPEGVETLELNNAIQLDARSSRR